MDHQGGKSFGQLKMKQQAELESINEEFINDDAYKEVANLTDRLKAYRGQFMEFDADNSGDIDFQELKLMLERIGQPKTHLECKKMIKEVDKTNSGTITYREFLEMMLGSKNSVLRLILLFEEKSRNEKASTQSKGRPPKRSIDELIQPQQTN